MGPRFAVAIIDQGVSSLRVGIGWNIISVAADSAPLVLLPIALELNASTEHPSESEDPTSEVAAVTPDVDDGHFRRGRRVGHESTPGNPS